MKTKRIKIDWEKVRMQQDIIHLKERMALMRGDYHEATRLLFETPEELNKLLPLTYKLNK